ncbi:MAG TPA: HNH endonuclease [Cyanobacteria bacterium UBA11149]|nr:HNH endonuclease [Cyanobacteria bacterium UBA11367]HBE56934.1 HNH endonuclease [Cyanobacteria bacterium UBA11366]HBK63570.1 HNH endonuclease [Cyanobacteria bacterium UBA11166]HBR73439.1 HNH endonuclease [Cyanobacteria bacterium UBA11159]HBS68716.1 HNH endonuclease [Cyanobacteria bacterium UBA11153]HBW91892.1 HNH endonuclease [Cyanobacteria bacterium UBA11149]HCA94541.1 HNH endonuclease [Cyanobacteria bacterium UBA9226]
MSSEYIPVALKQLVFDRAKGICEYCRSQAKFAIDSLVIDHIQPVSRGGETIANNLALSCQTCNNYKYTKTEANDPVTNEVVSLFHPRQMIWQEHFTWNEDVTQMIGITPVGRATIALLQTNREGVRNIRRVLAIMGYHPPD